MNSKIVNLTTEFTQYITTEKLRSSFIPATNHSPFTGMTADNTTVNVPGTDVSRTQSGFVNSTESVVRRTNDSSRGKIWNIFTYMTIYAFEMITRISTPFCMYVARI